MFDCILAQLPPVDLRQGRKVMFALHQPRPAWQRVGAVREDRWRYIVGLHIVSYGRQVNGRGVGRQIVLHVAARDRPVQPEEQMHGQSRRDAGG